MNPVEPPAGVHPEWYFMFLYQTLKIIPEWLTIILFTILLVFWTFVPFLDRKAHRGERSPLFTWIGIAAIAYLCIMTTWAYIAVGDESESGAKELIQQSPKQGGDSAK